MANILHLTASPRGAASHSRQISSEFVQAWLQAHPGDTVTVRDIGRQDIPHLTEELIGAFYMPAEHRTSAQRELLKLSDELVDELQAANLYVFGIPMYNFSVPAVFKAYIDLIVRIGLTVTSNWEGQLKDKKAIIVTARGGGGYGVGESRAAYNFEDPYLRTVMSLIGVTDQTFIHVTHTSDDLEAPKSLAAARAQINQLVEAQQEQFHRLAR
ncbi:NAD(P)H-dependent oxidoreductase [Hymenobacter sp. BT186]|uniref:FMN dependent NADH:quinone oxidoreductase n=1 Tax=Hymenobacter telluris TaxID=2816474 RepID=A0A939F0Z3_9BACT|nr:NAD(P)H-dependent oxidoreductase [Hymenobacter telluris]MBO0360844.1 NAD(P)H-dependent oxidoreductase [Hymenobacter telluris]MBW3376873.1 NAD(P)H-dependent oxidoreductase [Hymenobacter norwichensis]